MVYHLDVLVVLIYCYFWFLFSVFLKRNRVQNKTHYTLSDHLATILFLYMNPLNKKLESRLE